MKKVTAILLSAIMMLTSFGFVVFADEEITFTFTVNGSEATITGASYISDGITEFVIPSSVSDEDGTYTVTEIKDKAFENNGQVKGILTVPGTVKKIGASAFSGCRGLTAVNLEYGLTTIGEKAFYQIANWQQSGPAGTVDYVSIPSSVTSIGSAAFKGNAEINYIEFAEGLTRWSTEMTSGVGNVALGWTSVVIPSTVTTIDTSNFDWARNLEYIYVLSNNVTLTGKKFTESESLYPHQKGVGSQAGPSTSQIGAKIYYVNDSVKQAFIDYGYPEKRNDANQSAAFEKIETPSGFFHDFYKDEEQDEFGETGKMKPNIVASGETVPAPRGREGYRFLYWTINGQRVYPGDTLSLTKSISITGVWEKEKEADTVAYKNISEGKAVSEFTPATVDKMICKSLAKQDVEIKLTNSNGTKTITAYFDINGVWKNTSDTTLYSKVEMPDDYADLYILSKVDGEQNFEISLRQPKLLIAPRLNGVDDLNSITWSSSNPTAVKVDKGIVTGIASGSAKITATVSGDGNVEYKYTYNVEAYGELALAKKNNTVDAYITSKQPIFNAINSAISSKDTQALSDILSQSGDVKITDIQDIDASAIPTDETKLKDLADRIITYGEFKFENADDVETFISTLAHEIVVGELNGLTDTADVENVLVNNNAYYNLDLENTYYKQHKEKVLQRYVNYKAKNLKGVQDDFIDFYVMTAVLNVAQDSGYSVLQQIINNCSDEIGYDTDHYKKVNNVAFHTALLKKLKNNEITTKEDLKKYIDDAKAPSGGSTGGVTNKDNGVSTVIGDKGYGDVTTSIVGYEHDDYANNPLPEDTSSVFGDVSKDRWSYEPIKYLVAKNVITGYGDGNFCPENKITRAEFIKVLVSAFGMNVSTDTEKDETEENTGTFTDVLPDDWYYNFVETAYENGIVYGDTNGAFNPNTEISRQEMAAMIYRAVVASGKNIPIEKSAEITDRSSIDDWAYMPVIQLVNMGIINGYEDGSFKPFEKASREEVAKLTYEVMLKLSN